MHASRPMLPPGQTAASPEAAVAQGLARVETQLDAVGQALIAGDGPALQAASGALREASTDFSHCLAAPGAHQALAADPSLKARVRRAGTALGQHRTQLARRAAVVDRSLEALMPGVPKPVTYGASLFTG
ncbi:hypothetical protein [Xylophilus sp. ASV27]|uniref:hypothetical protein n=1 Tax=Xylophilus sp. ASV27 TaxID=2795129 RepID=UPI0018ECC8B0|nr:hypothetical protein [Xylophilus sp. ASV27]